MCDFREDRSGMWLWGCRKGFGTGLKSQGAKVIVTEIDPFVPTSSDGRISR